MARYQLPGPSDTEIVYKGDTKGMRLPAGDVIGIEVEEVHPKGGNRNKRGDR